MEKNETFEGMDELLDDVRDSSTQSKDYYKFIIGLATGTLVFSVTVLKGFTASPEYKIILVIGWLCLFASIVAGVLVLPKGDQLHSTVKLLKILFRSQEVVVAIAKKELQEHYLKVLIKGIINPALKEDEKKKEDIYLYLDKLPTKDLEEFLKKAGVLGVKDAKAFNFIKEFLEEVFKLFSLVKIVERKGNPSSVVKSLRTIILQIFWFEKVMKYAFFAGIVAISVFSLFNFFK